MRRRSFLLAVTGGVSGVAGCVAPASRDPGSRPAPDDATTGTTVDRAGQGSTPDLPVPESDLHRGTAKDAIPAIIDPAFDDEWGGITVEARNRLDGEPYEVELHLSPEDRVIGVERDGRARAYPLSVLRYHEVVNDRFDGPLLVTYCPLCGSGVVAERLVGGVETQFGVSGYLWRNDLVMYDDRTESLWSQILATAIRGPRTGDRLSLVPATTTTLGAWRRSHPETDVLLPPPESGTVLDSVSFDYSISPYAGYETSARTGVTGEFDDDRLHPKTEVLGVAVDGRARAYPVPTVASEGVVLDALGGVPLVVTVGPDREADSGRTAVAYDRRVDGRALEFVADGPEHLRADGSRWERLTGLAVDGPHEGRRLRRVTDVSTMFWFAWLDFYPDTDVYGHAD